jgi:hypothetical protein
MTLYTTEVVARWFFYMAEVAVGHDRCTDACIAISPCSKGCGSGPEELRTLSTPTTRRSPSCLSPALGQWNPPMFPMTPLCPFVSRRSDRPYLRREELCCGVLGLAGRGRASHNLITTCIYSSCLHSTYYDYGTPGLPVSSTQYNCVVRSGPIYGF